MKNHCDNMFRKIKTNRRSKIRLETVNSRQARLMRCKRIKTILEILRKYSFEKNLLCPSKVRFLVPFSIIYLILFAFVRLWNALDTSGRHTMSVDEVIRSNIANACVPRLDEAECERSICYNLYYRTFDGTCNNLQQPLRGAAFRPYNRYAISTPLFSNKCNTICFAF